MTGRNTTMLDQATIVAKLNRKMAGWANYFCLGPVSKAYRAVDGYASLRLRLGLRAKHKVLGSATGRFPDPRAQTTIARRKLGAASWMDVGSSLFEPSLLLSDVPQSYFRGLLLLGNVVLQRQVPR